MSASLLTVGHTEGELGVWTVALGDTRSNDHTRCTHLCWDEMLAQVVSLTHPSIAAPRFPMQTRAQEAEIERQREDRMRLIHAESQAEHDAKAAAITAMADALRQWRAAESADDGAEFANAQAARNAALDRASTAGLA